MDVIYLYDSRKKLRQPIVRGVTELIHAEDTYELSAELSAKYEAMPGEYLGFLCIDGRYRLFRIDDAEYDDEKDRCIITATDAAISELAHTVVDGAIRLDKKSLETALDKTLDGSGFELGTVTADLTETGYMTEYYPKRWKALREIAAEWDVRVIPYYVIENGEIVGKRVDVLVKENIYRGRIFEGISDSRNIAVTYSGVPVTRMYGIGESKDTEDPPNCVTFKDVEWKKSKGDPADKPKGQAYIEDAEAIALYGLGAEDVFEDKNEDDSKKLLKKTWKELKKRNKPQVSGVAKISDMEMIRGYSHKMVRLYDKVIARTRRGMDAEAVIVSIKRNYIRPAETRITLGEETTPTSTQKRQSIEQKVAAATGTSRSGSRSSAGGGSSRYIETAQLIQLNANTIQMNAEEIVQINSEVVEINGRLEATEADIGDLKAETAQFGKMLSGESIINSLSVVSLYINRDRVRRYTITDANGNTYKVFGYE